MSTWSVNFSVASFGRDNIKKTQTSRATPLFTWGQSVLVLVVPSNNAQTSMPLEAMDAHYEPGSLDNGVPLDPALDTNPAYKTQVHPNRWLRFAR